MPADTGYRSGVYPTQPDDGLSYVEPVNPRFFRAVASDPQIEESAKMRIVDAALNGRLALEKARSEIVRARQHETLNDLRIRREEFLLSEARREAADRQDMVTQGGAISSALQAVLDDPALDPRAKRDAMGRIRLRHSDAFVKSSALRDQFATAFNLVPDPAEAMTLSDRLRLRSDARAEYRLRKEVEDAQRRDEDRTRRERLEDLDSDFDILSKADFKANPDLKPGAPEYLDEFDNPLARRAAIGLIERFGPEVGVDVDPTTLGARALLDTAGDIRNRLRKAVSPAERDTRSKVDALGIPVE